MLITLYMVPYVFFTSFLGVFGGLAAIGIMTMGILRCSFLLVLLITGDMARLKSERTEGLSVVIEKIKFGWKKITEWLN